MSLTFQKTITDFCLTTKILIILIGKELELVKEAKKYVIDIGGVSSTKKRSFGIVNLDEGWKLFCLDTDPSVSAKASVGILTGLQLLLLLSDGVFKWILMKSRVCFKMPIASHDPML